jgi:hypothetical protein
MDHLSQDELLEGLRNELGALMAEAETLARWHQAKVARWSRARLGLGLPAVISAAVAGATGLASTAGRIPAAIIALVSAALGAAVAFLRIDDQIKSHSDLAAGWAALATDARMARNVDIVRKYGVETVSRELRDFVERRNTLLRGVVPAERSEGPVAAESAGPA